MIGVNHTSIYSVLFMWLCNLNARFTPIFLKITLIPHLLMFCRIKREIKQGNGRKLRRRTCYSKHWFAEAKLPFVKANEGHNKRQL